MFSIRSTMMSGVSKPSIKTAPKEIDQPAQWEIRSVSRVMEVGRDQILERSRRFVEAGYDLIGNKGMEGLTIRAVLKRTGLSRRAFYERFESKDDLMLALFEYSVRQAVDYYNEQMDKLPDPIARLKFILTHIFFGKSTLEEQASIENNRRGAAMCREHLRLAESRPEDLQEALRPLISLIAQQLANGMELGLVRNCNPENLATLVCNLVATTTQTELIAQDSDKINLERRKQLAEELWMFCFRGLAA